MEGRPETEGFSSSQYGVERGTEPMLVEEDMDRRRYVDGLREGAGQVYVRVGVLSE